MKLVRTEDAVGQVLCHDMTQIIPGVTKDAVFRKGHIVTEEDIPVLLSIGKEHIYVWENNENMLHENDAAEVLRRICQGEDRTAGNMKPTAPKEGKINLQATVPGVLKINREKLFAVNNLGEMMIATKRGDTLIRKEQVFAGMRVIPLVIEKEKMKRAEETAGPDPILRILPIHPKKAAILATGSEIYKGRIKDQFTPVVEGKLTQLGSTVIDRKILDDNAEVTTQVILEEVKNGAELVCVTGGMSVDPDDRTPLAIKNTGAHIISYGAPVLPGAMFLLSYLHVKADGSIVDYSTGSSEKTGESAVSAGTGTNETASADERIVPVVGLPGCVMYSKRTIFDIVLPRLLADDPVTAPELASLGEGGLL